MCDAEFQQVYYFVMGIQYYHSWYFFIACVGIHKCQVSCVCTALRYRMLVNAVHHYTVKDVIHHYVQPLSSYIY